jgi:hypothetical protein
MGTHVPRAITRILFIFILSILLNNLIMPSSFGEEPKSPSDESATREKSGFNLGAALISIYRDHISAVDSDRCPSYPSCSHFSVQAIKKHGFFIGWMMTVDRLIHEGKEEQKVSRTIYHEGKWKIYDPVENNDFWWYQPDKKPSQ